jgi:methionine-gamma-lyase
VPYVPHVPYVPQAAIVAILLAARGEGKRHVVGVLPLYGGTHSLLSCGMLDIEVTWATPETVREAIREDTALVICESPANPTCTICDVADICKQAGNIPVW